MNYFAVIDNELAIGGRTISNIAAQVGQTPFYVISRDAVVARIAELRAQLPQEVHLHYAVKANPMPALVHSITPLVDGLDVASGREMQVALNTGIDPGAVSMAGPGKSRAELRQAVAAGIVLNLESADEMRLVHDYGRALGVRPKAAVRVNPDFELKASGMRMSGGAKQFGVDAERVPEMLAEMKTLDLAFMGFHIFSGSQNLNAEAIITSQNQAVALGLHLADFAPSVLKTLNIGGGFGIPYFPGDRHLDVTDIGSNLRRLVSKVTAVSPTTQLVLELGRYIVGEAGVYVCEVVDRKISREHLFLVTNGGLHHHLAASGNFGQVLRKNYPLLVATRMDAATKEIVNVVGPLCTPLDILGDKVELPPAKVGDLIAVLQSGAYGRTASPEGFLSHPGVVEIVV
jgi:diaminopimelate decarboxylase